MFKMLRTYCCMRVNDTTKYGYPPKLGRRARYHWVCAKRKLDVACSEANCPVIAAHKKRIGVAHSANKHVTKLPPFEEIWKRIQIYPEWDAHLSSINRTMDCECFYDLICRQLRNM